MNRLDQAIARWDGQSTADLKSIYEHFAQTRHLTQQLLQSAALPKLQKGATWLLHHHAEQGWTANPAEAILAIDLMAQLQTWEARLHLLKCLPLLTIATTHKKTVERFLRKCLVDSNKFVRAWAYNGFHVLATQHAEYARETQQFFAMAMDDECASVKARIRQITQKGR